MHNYSIQSVYLFYTSDIFRCYNRNMSENISAFLLTVVYTYNSKLEAARSVENLVGGYCDTTENIYMIS
jgi:hypothetical protein